MNITHITCLTNNFEAAAHYQDTFCSNFKRVQQCLESSGITRPKTNSIKRVELNPIYVMCMPYLKV